MKITKIKQVSNQKYHLVLDDSEKITTNEDVILINHLLYQKNVNEELLNKIQIETAYYNLFYKTINYINVRLRSEKEVMVYLDKNRATIEEKNQIIDKLKQLGLIDEERFAKAYFNDKIYLSSYGPYKIKEELLSHNIDSSIVENLTQTMPYEEIYSKLEKMIIKKINSNKNQSNYLLNKKLIIYFINLGYDKDMIVDILSNNQVSDENIIVTEYNKIYTKLSKKYQGTKLNSLIRQKLYQKGFTYNQIEDFLK
ncbi:MAG: RecX family transcriptional regulator [Bacilli bacterium]|nr:RecX family transcriptional regulator [Bacilli bacterium]